MSEPSETEISVPNLDIKLSDGSNYQQWACMLRLFLSAHELDVIVDGDIPRPTVSETATDTSADASTIRTDSKKWQRANDRALCFMIVNTEATARSIVLMETDAHTAWERLRGQFEGIACANLMSLFNSICKLQFDNLITTIDEHLSEFEASWGRLASTVAGATDTSQPAGAYAVLVKCDGVKAQMLLATFQDYHKAIVSKIVSQSGSPTYESIAIQLRDLISNSGKVSESPATATPSAFATEASTPEVVCEFCKKKGWSGHGHLEAECLMKVRELEATWHQIQLANPDTEDSWEWALTADTTKLAPSSHWQYDSGCSVHITPFLSLLNNIIPYKKKVYGIGASEWSTHKGSTTISQDGKNVTIHNVLCVPNAPANLLSGQVLVSNDVFPIIHDGHPRLDYRGNTILKITLVGGKQMIISSEETALAVAQGQTAEWHLRYGHPLFQERSKQVNPPYHCTLQWWQQGARTVGRSAVRRKKADSLIRALTAAGLAHAASTGCVDSTPAAASHIDGGTSTRASVGNVLRG